MESPKNSRIVTSHARRTGKPVRRPPTSPATPERPLRYRLVRHNGGRALFRNDELISTDIRDIRRFDGHVTIIYAPIPRQIVANTATLADARIPMSVIAHTIPAKLLAKR